MKLRHLLSAALLASPLTAAERVAFVAGNCAYKAFSVLDNPKQDAAEVTRVLTALGFAVTRVDDLTADALKQRFTAFSAAHPDAKEIVFYFSGHGLQVHGENYLTGTDSKLFDAVKRGEELKALLPDKDDRISQLEKETRRDANLTMWSLSDLTGTLEKTGQKEAVRLVILDSCRDNPAGTKTVLPSKGFVKAEAPSGMLIAFAAKEGTTAAQTGAGQTSLYTQSLLKFLGVPGLTAEQVFKKTRAEVIKVSDGTQEPREYSSLTGELVFLPGGSSPLPDNPALLAKLAAMEKKLAELEKEGGNSKAEADRLKAELAAMSVPPRAVPVPAASGNASFGEPAAGKTTTVSLPGGVKVKLCGIPAGSFTMGSPAGEADRIADEKQARVTLTKAFWMPATEFTQAQWQAVKGTNPSSFKGDTLPVEDVSWHEVQACIKALNSKAPLPAGWQWALPSEAQWEYACRAGTTTAFSFGNTATSVEANFDGNSPYGTTRKGTYLEKTAAVGSYQANAWGLYDMHGNVDEWCADAWDCSTVLPGGTNPLGKNGLYRVVRGGSWGDYGKGCRAAHRSRYATVNRYWYLGFRPAAVPAGQ